MARSRDIDDVPNYSNRGPDRRKPSDSCDLLTLPDDKYLRLRLFGGVVSYGGHWVKTRDKETGRWRTGNKGSFFVPCAAWDLENATRKGGNGAKHCAFCAFEAAQAAANVDKEARRSRFSVDHFINAIVRSRAARPPQDMPEPTREEAKSGFKNIESETWTPVSVLRMTGSVVEKLRELKQLNVHEDDAGTSAAYSVTHPKFGCDVQIMKRSKPATPADTYALQKGDPKPLSKAERALLKYDIEDLSDFMSEEEVKAEFERWAQRHKPETRVGGGDDEDDQPRRRKRSVEDDDGGFEDERKPAKKPARRPADDDEGDDGFDDEPPKKPAKKPARRPADDDDLDEDDDGFDDEPPKKPAKKSATKRRPADEDDGEDDGFDDEPPKKPAKKTAKKPVRKSQDLPLDDDDDDDGDGDDEYEDSKPAKKPAAKKPAPRRRPAADDDDDFS